jgi:predicted amidohydrolase
VITNGLPEGWQTWSPRAEITPRFLVDSHRGCAGAGTLRIDTLKNAAAFGAWCRTIRGIQEARPYRFSAKYRVRGVPHERRSVIARLQWLDDSGRALRPPDYALDDRRGGPWALVEYATAAPPGARALAVQLALGFVAGGSVWWDDIRLVEEEKPRERVVRAMTVFHRPSNSASPAASVESFCRLVESARDQRPDLVCLPEGITVVGTGQDYAEVSEPVPGPTTRRLGQLAKSLNAHVVAGLYERVDQVVYNTAVLLDRSGQLAGVYRKTHLPREEWEKGVTAGDRYPVFDTDFGKVGLIICWDLQFPEPSRAMALQGAEILLLPIWGGNEVLARARAIENHVFLVSATYDMRSWALDPTGQVLAEATRQGPVATAELRLDRKFPQPWLGDMRTRTWKERRPDIPMP